MSNSKKNRRFNFGRLFFPGEPKAIPDEIRLQPLGDHVGNVRRLVKKWKNFPQVSDSRERVLKSADLHDMGKPQRFSIQVQTNLKGKFKQYIYSFKGHRFLAESPDVWAETLAKGHHDFSVKDISRDTYKLKQHNSKYEELLTQDPLAYAHELYILEMCDQIEAELACRVIGDDAQAESRTFMDCTIAKSKFDTSTYLLDPWEFEEDELELTFKYWTKTLEIEETAKLEVICSKDSDSKLGSTLDQIVKSWWKSLEKDPRIESRKIKLKPLSRELAENVDVVSIYQKLAGFEPNPMQSDMYGAIAETDHPAVMLKGPTGAGKTESIVFPALAKGYRLILPLPAKSLLEDQKKRIEKYLIRFSKLPENYDREVSLVVDTGSQMRRWVYKNGEDITSKLAINLRRHLYKGDVILTTLDKFLYRYFSFGDKQKSFIFPFRINHARTLICFDEAHSYDEIAFTNFRSLVKALYEAGRSLVLMTATMPPEQAAQFDYLDTIDYIEDEQNVAKLFHFQQQALKQPYLGQRRFSWVNQLSRNSEFPEVFQNEFANLILKEWKLKSNRRILVVLETVKDAAAIYQQLKQHIGQPEERFLFLYHGRIADQLRTALYQEIQQCDEQKKPYILVTTSAIEVGCDLNAEILISQICPPENLIQRAGRCNRRGDVEDAKVIVVGDTIPEFANTLNDEGWDVYQRTLKNLTVFDTREISKCIIRTQNVDDYRVVELFSMLHDYVYAADLTCQPAHEKGVVVTRSWTPSATLIYDDGSHGDELAKMPQISVPLDRLIFKKDQMTGEFLNQYAATNIYERFYHQEQTRWLIQDLRHGSAYQKEIIIKLGPYEQATDPGLEYKYEEEIGFLDLPGVFTKWRPVGFDEKLHCKHSDKNFAIITYTKAFSTPSLQEAN